MYDFVCNFLSTVFLTLNPIFILIHIYCRYTSVDKTVVCRGTLLFIIIIIIFRLLTAQKHYRFLSDIYFGKFFLP